MILTFNKPYGWTSFNLVAKARAELSHRLGIKKLKVGHAGTLDPLATGVLILCTEKDTKKIDELQSHTKEYVATLKLGATTPSFDMEKSEDSTYSTEGVTREKVEEVLTKFRGTIQQVPPVFSAVKVDGKRAFKYARQGEEVELKAKTLVIDEIELLSYGIIEPQQTDAPDDSRVSIVFENLTSPYLSACIRVVCSKGTYIRALARDIGEALGCGAYLTDLVRTRIGDYKIQDCLEINDFGEWVSKNISEIKKN